ncbi:MAG: TMEM175 family protein [Halobacteriota archaeon]
MSFVVVGAFWISHHEIFDRVVRYGRVFVWIDFMFLLCIVFMPFPTALAARYSYWISAAVYAASVAAAGSVLALLWQYAAHHYRLIDRTLSPRDIHMSTVRSLVTPAVFLLPIPVAYLNSRFAPCTWLSSFAIRWAIHRRIERSAPDRSVKNVQVL